MARNLTLLTDLYQLTMAQGYWQQLKPGIEACFYMFFRDNPFKGGYAVSCGMDQVAELVEGFGFSAEDLDYLAGLKAPSRRRRRRGSRGSGNGGGQQPQGAPKQAAEQGSERKPRPGQNSSTLHGQQGGSSAEGAEKKPRRRRRRGGRGKGGNGSGAPASE